MQHTFKNDYQDVQNSSVEEGKMSWRYTITGCRDGTVVRAFASHQCGPGAIPRSGIMWVEFVGSLLCTKRFSPGSVVSPLLNNQHLT